MKMISAHTRWRLSIMCHNDRSPDSPSLTVEQPARGFNWDSEQVFGIASDRVAWRLFQVVWYEFQGVRWLWCAC